MWSYSKQNTSLNLHLHPHNSLVSARFPSWLWIAFQTQMKSYCHHFIIRLPVQPALAKHLLLRISFSVLPFPAMWSVATQPNFHCFIYAPRETSFASLRFSFLRGVNPLQCYPQIWVSYNYTCYLIVTGVSAEPFLNLYARVWERASARLAIKIVKESGWCL